MSDADDTAAEPPRTLREVDLPSRIRAAGGKSLKVAGVFFGWEPGRVIKSADEFSIDLLLRHGWTRQRLMDVADADEQIARITPENPSASGRAAQLRELAELFV